MKNRSGIIYDLDTLIDLEMDLQGCVYFLANRLLGLDIIDFRKQITELKNHTSHIVKKSGDQSQQIEKLTELSIENYAMFKTYVNQIIMISSKESGESVEDISKLFTELANELRLELYAELATRKDGDLFNYSTDDKGNIIKIE